MNLIMISAMYENGGNVTHRHLDGHPELFVYPFESQLGTRYVSDELLSMFPFKYRWPVFPLEGTAAQDFEMFFDEELKTRLRRPDGSKFRSADLDLKESERKAIYTQIMSNKTRNTGNNVMAFFDASFSAWKNYKKSGNEKYFVGYSPIIGVDADRIFADLPQSYVLHVVRNPLACYSETKYRPFPLSLKRYIWTWNYVQYRALVFKEKYPERFLIVRYEDILSKKQEVMDQLCVNLNIHFNESLLSPSWNSEKLDDVYPWGTIHSPDTDEQNTRKQELTDAEIDEARQISKFFIKEFNYELP